MDFHSLHRRDLQTLCKKNQIRANMTNIAMANALQALETVEGIDELHESLTFQPSNKSKTKFKTSRQIPKNEEEGKQEFSRGIPKTLAASDTRNSREEEQQETKEGSDEIPDIPITRKRQREFLEEKAKCLKTNCRKRQASRSQIEAVKINPIADFTEASASSTVAPQSTLELIHKDAEKGNPSHQKVEFGENGGKTSPLICCRAVSEDMISSRPIRTKSDLGIEDVVDSNVDREELHGNLTQNQLSRDPEANSSILVKEELELATEASTEIEGGRHDSRRELEVVEEEISQNSVATTVMMKNAEGNEVANESAEISMKGFNDPCIELEVRGICSIRGDKIPTSGQPSNVPTTAMMKNAEGNGVAHESAEISMKGFNDRCIELEVRGICSIRGDKIPTSGQPSNVTELLDYHQRECSEEIPNIRDDGEKMSSLVRCSAVYNNLFIEEIIPSGPTGTKSNLHSRDRVNLYDRPDENVECEEIQRKFQKKPSSKSQELSSRDFNPEANCPLFVKEEPEHAKEPAIEVEGGRHDCRQQIGETSQEEILQNALTKTILIPNESEEIFVKGFDAPFIEDPKQSTEVNPMLDGRRIYPIRGEGTPNEAAHESADISVKGSDDPWVEDPTHCAEGNSMLEGRRACPIRGDGSPNEVALESDPSIEDPTQCMEENLILEGQRTCPIKEDEIPKIDNEARFEKSSSPDFNQCPTDMTTESPVMISEETSKSLIGLNGPSVGYLMIENEYKDCALERTSTLMKNENQRIGDERRSEGGEQGKEEKQRLEEKVGLEGFSLRKLKLMYKDRREAKGLNLLSKVDFPAYGDQLSSVTELLKSHERRSESQGFNDCLTDVTADSPVRVTENGFHVCMLERTLSSMKKDSQRTGEKLGRESEEQREEEKQRLENKDGLKEFSLRKLKMMYKDKRKAKGLNLLSKVEEGGFGVPKMENELEKHSGKELNADFSCLSLRKLKSIYKEKITMDS